MRRRVSLPPICPTRAPPLVTPLLPACLLHAVRSMSARHGARDRVRSSHFRRMATAYPRGPGSTVRPVVHTRTPNCDTPASVSGLPHDPSVIFFFLNDPPPPEISPLPQPPPLPI